MNNVSLFSINIIIVPTISASTKPSSLGSPINPRKEVSGIICHHPHENVQFFTVIFIKCPYTSKCLLFSHFVQETNEIDVQEEQSFDSLSEICLDLRKMFITLVWNDHLPVSYNYPSHSFLCISNFNLLLHY